MVIDLQLQVEVPDGSDPAEVARTVNRVISNGYAESQDPDNFGDKDCLFLSKCSILDLQLTDANKVYFPAQGERPATTIEVHPGGIDIFLDGYGTAGMEPGNSSVIFADFYDGQSRVLVWNNINDEEPVKLSLEQAKEIYRKET